MHLTDKQRQIIASYQLQAGASATVVAAETGYKEHTVRYCLEDLRSRGVVTPTAVVNPTALGFVSHTIYLSRSPEQKAARERLVSALVRSETVARVTETGGAYHFVVTAYARKTRDLAVLFGELSDASGGRFLERSVTVPVRSVMFRSKHLSPHPSAVDELLPIDDVPEAVTDANDHVILRELTGPRSASRVSVSRATGIPVSTLDYRIRKLERARVITGYSYVFDAPAAGLRVFMLLVTAGNQSGALSARFLSFCAEHPNIVLVNHCVGRWDFEVTVEVHCERSVIDICGELGEKFPGLIADVQVLTCFEKHKATLYPFVKPVKA